LDDLELRDSSWQITGALKRSLKADFSGNCEALINALHPVEDAQLNQMTTDEDGIRGWPIMPVADYVAEAGLNDVKTSLKTLRQLTMRFSAEFAIRPFIVDAPDETLQTILNWTKDENFHVRRLASEGCRPRLPWGIRLKSLVDDPAPIMPILENLKDDPEEYVRRSVANNVNDIAKDHPDFVAKLATNWLKSPSSNRQRLVKHACRSLIKSGHQPTLRALGYDSAGVEITELSLKANKLRQGENLEITLEIQSKKDVSQPLIIDFLIHYVKANGKTSPKVFKWKELELKAKDSTRLTKKQSFKPVTTRTLYAGMHEVEIQINGNKMASLPFELAL